jgi:hypothetical protein
MCTWQVSLLEGLDYPEERATVVGEAAQSSSWAVDGAKNPEFPSNNAQFYSKFTKKNLPCLQGETKDMPTFQKLGGN